MSNLHDSVLAVQSLPVDPSQAPDYLRSLKRWTAWALIPGKGGKKPAKKPLSLTNDDATWKSFDEARKAAEGRAGIGFQMLGVSTIVGLDLDNCISNGELSPFARALLDALPDTYAEVTPSLKGLRLFAALPSGMVVPEFLNREKGVECYVGKSARFLTVTGRALPGRAGLWGEMTPQAVRLLAPLAAAGGVIDLEIKLPVPNLPRILDAGWQGLLHPAVDYAKLKADWRTYLEQGDAPGKRSEFTFGIACRLIEARIPLETVFAFLVSAPGSWEAALDKRDRDERRARELIWADIGRAQRMVRAEETSRAERMDEWTSLGLRLTVEGKKVRVDQSPANAARILTAHPDFQNRVALDVTTGLVLLDGTPLDDYRFFLLQEQVCAYAAWQPMSGRQWWSDILRAVGERNQINPRAAWLRSLKWDGVSRLDGWMNDHLAAEKSSINAKLGRMWLISLVARWLEPGCKNDTVLILIGEEGTRKTSFFEVMAGGPDKVTMLNGFERDDRFVAAKAWLVEIPEAHLFKRADRNRLKAFVTERVDQYRPPYAATPVVVQRGFVIVSTANTEEVLTSDQDGLRRFWPVVVRNSKIDLAWVEANREQLFAEAVLAYDLEEPWWFDETPTDLQERVAAAVESSSVDDAIERLVHTQAGKGGLTLGEVMSELGAQLGYRPPERLVLNLLWKHGLRKTRTATARFWMHPSWKVKDGNVVELKPAKVAKGE